ncbi:MAG: hypothetical protein LUD15_00430 [Bacteroides sp.]|nr:hypothetical protein [Bacteroides sp.]
MSDNPRPEDLRGVSWWFRTLDIPADLKERHFILHFESVRMRAEVYLDGRLVGYDIVGESPFHADLTPFIKPGEKHQLAVRVTNPSGNFHWQDFNIDKWDNYHVPPGRGFGGIIGRVKMKVVNPVYISDLYMQNTPNLTQVNAIISFHNNHLKNVTHDIEVIVRKKRTRKKLFSGIR